VRLVGETLADSAKEHEMLWFKEYIPDEFILFGC